MADRRLQVFHAVARHGSFTRAAEALYMTQPAVTFQIKQLEEYFNTRLIERGHGRLGLTPAGEIVMAYAERILGLSEELDARVSELTDELAGVLNLGVSTTISAYWLPYLLEGFKRQYPKVVPRVRVGNSEYIESNVAERELDVGLIEKISQHPSVEAQNALRDELMVVVQPGHRLARQPKLAAEDLVHAPFITREPGNGIRVITDQFFRDNGVSLENLKLCAELGSLECVKHLVEEGMGFAFASRAAIHREVREGRLKAIPVDPPLYTPLEVILPKDKFRSRLVATFVEFAKNEFERLGEEITHSMATQVSMTDHH